MKSENWQSGQKVLKQDMIQSETAPEQAVKDRQVDNFVSGISNDLQNAMAFLPGNTPTSITIDTGTGYDSTGERILISSSVVPWNPANLAQTTPNGIGGNTSTPQSSGSNSIPMTSGVVNLLYIQYVGDINPLVFSIHKITGGKLFTQINDGYEIRVVNAGSVDPNTININASAPGTGGPWIFLGWVDYRAGGVISTSMFNASKRPLYQININRVQGITPKADFSNVTPLGNYLPNQTVDFDAHVKAIGHGLPSNTNPHGTTLQDIGFSGKTVEQHEEFLHCPGIVNGNLASNTGDSLNLIVNPQCPNLDQIIIYGLNSNQFLVMPALSDVTSVTFTSTQLLTTLFSFNSLLTGTYYFYVDSSLATIVLSATAPTQPYQFLLWTIGFNTSKGSTNIPLAHFLIPSSGPCAGTSNFTNLIDSRLFGNTCSNVLQVDSATDTFTLNHNVHFTKNLQIDGIINSLPTITTLTSGSGVYTTPVGSKQLHVKMRGAGGGGGANDTNNGFAGSDSSFNSIVAKGGGLGVANGPDGAGGTGGAGSVNLRIDGTAGLYKQNSSLNANGRAAPANSGLGGQGGAWSSASQLGGSGGDGEYVEFLVNSPNITYSYIVGAGGAGGAISNVSGGAGGSGFIFIEERYV